MYEAVADRIKYHELFLKFNLPNTFNSWFLITELHVWMLMVRAMAEGSETGQPGKFMRNCIVEALWSDVSKRAKKLNAGNPSEMRNQIQVLSEQFQAALITYDEGLMLDDKVLAGALWRRFFEMKCDNYEHLETMVKYVRLQVRFPELFIVPSKTYCGYIFVCRLNSWTISIDMILLSNRKSNGSTLMMFDMNIALDYDNGMVEMFLLIKM